MRVEGAANNRANVCYLDSRPFVFSTILLDLIYWTDFSVAVQCRGTRFLITIIMKKIEVQFDETETVFEAVVQKEEVCELCYEGNCSHNCHGDSDRTAADYADSEANVTE